MKTLEIANKIAANLNADGRFPATVAAANGNHYVNVQSLGSGSFTVHKNGKVYASFSRNQGSICSATKVDAKRNTYYGD